MVVCCNVNELSCVCLYRKNIATFLLRNATKIAKLFATKCHENCYDFATFLSLVTYKNLSCAQPDGCDYTEKTCHKISHETFSWLQFFVFIPAICAGFDWCDIFFGGLATVCYDKIRGNHFICFFLSD